MKNIFVFILFLSCSIIFADPVIITENGQTMTVELVNAERAQRLKGLYESRYRYVYIMDSIELDAMFREDDSNKTNNSLELESFREQIFNVPEGEYKVATISVSNSQYLFLGLMYFGHDYFFMVMFTNSYDSDFINLSYDRRRYENIFNSSWEMLF
jgi:hypothetical protein